jgi:hypothetical protein
MKTLIALTIAVAASGCGAYGSKAGSASLVSDLTLAAGCAAEVQSSAPACLAEVPSCVSLGKGVVAAAQGK